MKLSAIKCKKCKNIIYSRARHDFRYCPCGFCFVDGGLDYLSYGGELNDIETLEIEVDTNEKELYNDWNRSVNQLGLIPPKE